MIWTLISIFLFGMAVGIFWGMRLSESLRRQEQQAQAYHASQIIKPEHLKRKVESEPEKN